MDIVSTLEEWLREHGLEAAKDQNQIDLRDGGWVYAQILISDGTLTLLYIGVVNTFLVHSRYQLSDPQSLDDLLTNIELCHELAYRPVAYFVGDKWRTGELAM